MSTLLAIWSLGLRETLRRQRKGAAVLETVLLILVAVVILFVIVQKFAGEGGFIGQIFGKMKDILNIAKNPQ